MKKTSAKKYVNRPSQYGEHRAPSPRLKARRKKALTGPKGYFPNPSPRKTAAQKLQAAIFKKANELIREGYARAQAFAIAYHEKGETKKQAPKKGQAPKKNPVASRIRSRPKTGKPTKRIYTVEMASALEGPYKTEGIFPTAASAKEYAHALDAKHNRTKYIRVTV